MHTSISAILKKYIYVIIPLRSVDLKIVLNTMVTVASIQLTAKAQTNTKGHTIRTLLECIEMFELTIDFVLLFLVHFVVGPISSGEGLFVQSF